MSRMNGTLKITLKSDLCVASGFSYAGGIDSDVVYDAFGFPYIPGKRLKGCLRDSADFLVKMGYSTEAFVENVFGKRGDKKAASLKIGNAIIPEVDSLKEEIKRSAGKYKMYLGQQNILEQYTSVRGQTKIEEYSGVAKENTLRFTRVVNHYNPFNEEELIFEAPISFEEEEKDFIVSAISVTRNIGLNRNRGLGSVVMEYVDQIAGNDLAAEPCIRHSEQSGKKVIKYVFKNTEPLMLSSESDSDSETYINGASILGVLANAYLKKGGKDTDSFFRNVFLSGKAIFSDATPAIKQVKDKTITYLESYPVPQYVRKMKKSGKIVNILDQGKIESITEWEYKPENGNQPKKLKTEYLVETEEGLSIVKTQKEITYHHRKKNESRRQDELLFVLDVVESGQFFAGEIIVEDKSDLDILVELMRNTEWSFGKSRSSQYGKCCLVNLITEDQKEKQMNTNNKEDFVLTFLSDTAILNEDGTFSVYESDIKDVVLDTLNISNKDQVNITWYLDTKILTGYMGVWNLQREQIPAIKAGSACVISGAVFDKKPSASGMLGEKNHEGLGRYRLQKMKDFSYIVKVNDLPEGNLRTEGVSPQLEIIYKKIKREEELASIINNVNPSKSKLTASAIGRITLMLKDSMKVEPEKESKETKEKYQAEDFKKRVKSIKNKKTQQEALDLVYGVLELFKEGDSYRADWSLCMNKVLTKYKYAKKYEEKGEQ